MTTETERAIMAVLSVLVWKFGRVVLDESKEIEYHVMELTTDDFVNFGEQNIEMLIGDGITQYRVRKINT